MKDWKQRLETVMAEEIAFSNEKIEEFKKALLEHGVGYAIAWTGKYAVLAEERIKIVKHVAKLLSLKDDDPETRIDETLEEIYKYRTSVFSGFRIQDTGGIFHIPVDNLKLEAKIKMLSASPRVTLSQIENILLEVKDHEDRT